MKEEQLKEVEERAAKGESFAPALVLEMAAEIRRVRGIAWDFAKQKFDAEMALNRAVEQITSARTALYRDTK